MSKPSVPAHHWDFASCQIQLSISVMGSSKDVIDYPPQSAITCPKYATALPSILKWFKNASIHMELNAPRRLTINKWRHCILYAPILMLPVLVSVPMCNWLQRQPIRRTLMGWLLFSIFVGMILLCLMTGTFLRRWHCGTAEIGRASCRERVLS